MKKKKASKRKPKKQKCANCHELGTIAVESDGDLLCEYCEWGDRENWRIACMFNILENNIAKLLSGEK